MGQKFWLFYFIFLIFYNHQCREVKKKRLIFPPPHVFKTDSLWLPQCEGARRFPPRHDYPLKSLTPSWGVWGRPVHPLLQCPPSLELLGSLSTSVLVVQVLHGRSDRAIEWNWYSTRPWCHPSLCPLPTIIILQYGRRRQQKQRLLSLVLFIYFHKARHWYLFQGSGIISLVEKLKMVSPPSVYTMMTSTHRII